jgi:hypothetical protein
MLRTTALINRWRLVHGGHTDIRSILPRYLGHTEHLHYTLGKSLNMDYGLANSRLQSILLLHHLKCICLHEAESTRHQEASKSVSSCEIWGSHGMIKKCCLLGSVTAQSGRTSLMFLWNIIILLQDYTTSHPKRQYSSISIYPNSFARLLNDIFSTA